MILIPILLFISYPNIKNILIEKYGKETTLLYDGSPSYKLQNKIKLKNFEIHLRDNLLSTNDSLNENSLLDKIQSFSNSH